MTGGTTALTHRWRLNYLDERKNVSASSQPSRSNETRAVLEKFFTPPGFPEATSSRDPVELNEVKNIKAEEEKPGNTRKVLKASFRASWMAAFSPFRALLTTGFALYMTGSSVQFFSVASTVAVLLMHLRSLFQIRETFQPIFSSGIQNHATIIPQLIVHFLLCCAGVAMGLYKAHVLGFLPTTQSDWVALLPLRKVESSFLIRGIAM